MRAAWIDAPGPAGAIRIGELPVPSPAATDVLVRVAATVVNPVDTFVRSGAYATTLRFPFVIGRDLVGTVEATGSAVEAFRQGDAVWCNSLGHAGRQGAAAQFAVVPADRLYRMPDGVDPVAAVAVLHPGATAWLGLFGRAGLVAGERVHVGGAAGHVGSAAVLLAAQAGASVVASAGHDDLDHCRALGAETAVDYRDDALWDRLRAAAPGGFDIQLDTSGRQDIDCAVGLLAPRGRIVVMAGMQRRCTVPVGPLYTRDGSLLGFAISNARVAELAAAAARINELLATGALKARRIEVLPLAAAARAHRCLEEAGTGGARLVLVP